MLLLTTTKKPETSYIADHSKDLLKAHPFFHFPSGLSFEPLTTHRGSHVKNSLTSELKNSHLSLNSTKTCTWKSHGWFTHLQTQVLLSNSLQLFHFVMKTSNSSSSPQIREKKVFFQLYFRFINSDPRIYYHTISSRKELHSTRYTRH